MIKLKDLLNEESAMKAIINAKKGAKASGGGYSNWFKIGKNSWKNKKTGRLAHNAGLYDRIGEFSDFVIEGKLTESSRLSFKDAGISNLMDLKNATDSLTKSNINWDQKGQALVFRNANDTKEAKQILGLKEGKLNESYNQSDVNYAMKMAFDSIPGNWHKALKRVKYSKRSKSIKLNMSSYMGPSQVLQKIVKEFNRSMGTKYKIDKDSFVKGSITSIELRER